MRETVQNLLFLLILSMVSASCAAEEALSITFSGKNQVRTAMTWIQFKSQLLNVKTGRSQKLPPDSEARAISDDLILAHPVYSRVGRLFFTQDYGQVSQCSAFLVGDESSDESIIATAAHCVMSLNGDWNSDFLFVRGYGSGDQDIFSIECVGVPAEWGEKQGEGILNVDYAFLKSRRENTFGGLSVQIGSEPPKEMRIVGYSDNHMEGKQMLEVAVGVLPDQYQLRASNNPFGKGNSGAPWITQSGTQIFSVSSHYDRYKDDVMVGPRLTPATRGLLEFVQRGCRR